MRQTHEVGMKKRIVVINGHPDSENSHLCHALAQSYTEGGIKAGHDVRIIEIGKLDFPLLNSKSEWEQNAVPGSIKDAQNDLLWAEHWALIYPLWLGDMPAKLKGFLEQCLRPGMSYIESNPEGKWDQLLIGRSARIVVTMAMPTSVYRVFYAAHTVKSLERNILKYCGITPVKSTLIGNVYNAKRKALEVKIDKMSAYGFEGV